MKKRTRWVLLCLCLCCLIILPLIGLLASDSTVEFNAHRLLFNRHTIYPFRSIMEHAGKVVNWDENGRKITIQESSDSFNLNIDTNSVQGIPVYVNKEYIGKSPVNMRVSAGKYLVTIKPPGYVGSIRYLTLKPEHAHDQKIVLPVDQHSYQDLLDLILQQGYQPIRVMDYYNHTPITKKTIVLRHDVDDSAEYALKMAEIEHAKGIKSTFYFRWSTVDSKVIQSIRDMGHEVGLHYETLATYAKEHHFESAQEITPQVTEELRRLLKLEIANFRQQFGEINTISSHGADYNNKLGVTNYKAIMEGQNPKDYGIIGTAYGEITKRFTYMSDAGGIWEPFPYPKLENDEGPFYILIHPISWVSSYNSK